MRRTVQIIITVLLPLIISGQSAESSSVPEIIASRLQSPLKIDGALNENLYLKDSFSYFIQVEPDNGIPATEKTEVWVGYDDNALYIGACLWDSHPDSITTRMGRRDADFNADDFEVAIQEGANLVRIGRAIFGQRR